MTAAIVGRPKKAAKQQNYKISFDLLARLRAISILEDRNDTAQVERWIREGSERWLVVNQDKTHQFNDLVAKYMADHEVEN
jgi:predicted DNA binding protein